MKARTASANPGAVLLFVAFAALVSSASPSSPSVLVLDVSAPELEKDDVKRIAKLVEKRGDVDGGKTSCDVDAPACLKQIAATGHAYVLSTRAGKVSGNYTIALAVVDTKTASVVSQAAIDGWDLSEVLGKLPAALDDVWSKIPASEATTTPEDSTTPAATSTATPKAAPPLDVRTWLEIGGGVAIGVGVVAAIAGSVPAFQYAGAKDDLRAKTSSYDGSSTSLQAAATVRKAALDDKDAYNNVGHWVVDAGLVLVVAGAGALGYALFAPVPE